MAKTNVHIQYAPHFAGDKCPRCGAVYLDKNITQVTSGLCQSTAIVMYECGAEHLFEWEDFGITLRELVYPCPETGKLPQ